MIRLYCNYKQQQQNQPNKQQTNKQNRKINNM